MTTSIKFGRDEEEESFEVSNSNDMLIVGSPKKMANPNRSSSDGKNRSKRLVTGIAVVLGVSVPVLIPLAHIVIFYHFWGDLAYPVDKKKCSCDCWDTVFKGPYETGVANYKHVYFNSTRNTLKMWIITVLFVAFLYETFKHLTLLGFKGRLRPSMTLLFFTSLHSHYYGWWGQWNYWNDEFYAQWAHQLFFTLSELFSTAMVLFCLDKNRPLRPQPLIFIANVALFHIGIASKDQFINNIIKGRGKTHQVIRDIILMSTDCIQVAVAAYELKQYAARKSISVKQILRQRDNTIRIGVTTLVMLSYILVCPS